MGKPFDGRGVATRHRTSGFRRLKTLLFPVLAEGVRFEDDAQLRLLLERETIEMIAFISWMLVSKRLINRLI